MKKYIKKRKNTLKMHIFLYFGIEITKLYGIIGVDMGALAVNRRARFDYFLEAFYEAGISLEGSEVKSIRNNGLSLAESFVQIVNGEVWLKNCYIHPYVNASVYAPNPRRNRKLLLNKSEIKKLISLTKEKGYTLVATKVYLKGGLVKVEIAVAKGKKNYDKRQSLKDATIKKEIQKVLKRS